MPADDGVREVADPSTRGTDTARNTTVAAAIAAVTFNNVVARIWERIDSRLSVAWP
jgi:hypothetical protein